MSDVTELLHRINEGDPSANHELLPLIYADLRHLARSKLQKERIDLSLQATSLVHEVYLRLMEGNTHWRIWQNRAHFFAVAAEAMRRILIDSIRQRNAIKRGGGRDKLSLDEVDGVAERKDRQWIAVHDALTRLEELDPLKASLVKLRFFSGFSQIEAAEALGIPRRTADRHWAFARAFLLSEIQEDLLT